MTTQTQNRIKLNLIRTVDDSYDIVVGAEMFHQIAEELKRDCPKVSKFAIITDSNVCPIYAGKLEECLKEQSLTCRTFPFNAGEENKNMTTVNQLLNQLGEAKYNRDSLVIALGGGVVGDTAGLVASLINRGVPYVQIPTTTLAQADSAVGGKTGVDLPAGKNLAGAFKQPFRVYMDVHTLGTLDERNFRAGLVEVIKNGVVQNADFFRYLEVNIERILARDEEVLMYLARQNSIIKGNVVEIDPGEKGLRRILNYGHTLGHAIETASNYELLHGEAVAIGMRLAGIIASRTNDFPAEDLERQNDLLEKLGVLVKIPSTISDEEILAITLNDKKVAAGKARYCLPKRIGSMGEFEGQYSTPVEENIVKTILDNYRI